MIRAVISFCGAGMLQMSSSESFAAPSMANGNEIMLSVRNLTKTYRSAGEEIAVLRGVHLDVAAGERITLTGGSGSGQRTLLHLTAWRDSVDGGAIQLTHIN